MMEIKFLSIFLNFRNNAQYIHKNSGQSLPEGELLTAT